MRVSFVFAMATLCMADVYMHNPRGSNNRWLRNDDTNAVSNANRLFDSQNNNKGGYNIGAQSNNRDKMYYYEGSILTVEWTQQHACAALSSTSEKTHCEVILQYMCDSGVRDGSTTSTINADPSTSTDETFGMHEPYDFYEACEARQRNMGLFLADRNIVDPLGSTATYTRQNNNANRHGFECAEERDYYPYWHPTPWKDIAVLTSQPSRCALYQAESQNVKAKNYCERPNEAFNNEIDCPAASWLSQPAWGIAAPECRAAEWARDNHLGNTMSGYMPHYNWTIPSAASNQGSCVLRVRYNVSTSDYDGWSTDASFNDLLSPVMQDPYIDFGSGFMELALNTNQYGRTFQDRSHSFSILAAPSNPTCATIYNVNVRGKRGTIVEAYPAVQYDFVPNRLDINAGDCVHFQWTGSDSNSANTQRGQGADRTDRSNICQIETLQDNICLPISQVNMFDGTGAPQTTANDFAFLRQSNCATLSALLARYFDINTGVSDYNAVEQDVQNCMVLNAASPYFDGGLVQFNTPDVYFYMSTRNNNIGWQSQKATIVVNP